MTNETRTTGTAFGKDTAGSMGTLIETAKTRDLVLSHIEELGDVYSYLEELFRKLDMLDDAAFITMATAEIVRIASNWCDGMFEIIKE